MIPQCFVISSQSAWLEKDEGAHEDAIKLKREKLLDPLVLDCLMSFLVVNFQN